VFIEYGRAPGEVAAAFDARGWTRGVTGLEWGSPNPAAPIMSAVAELLRARGATLAAADLLVDQIRLYKSKAELERVRRAAAIADDALTTLQSELKPGLTGLAVSARLTTLLAERGSEVAAMQPLVNSGSMAWTDTHAFPSARRLEPGDVVTIDCCGVIDRYHANLGRTFSVGVPNPRAARLLEQAAGSIEVLTRAARVGEGPESAAAAAVSYVRERIAPEHIWWVGGYALGIAFPPSWVGHTYLANDGIEKCTLRPGYVSNYENVLFDRADGFEAAYIDTLVATEQGLEVLTRMPRGLLPGGG
jgi:Xaa-Pro aminopeptidase